ncbi:protein N-terminal asparagine amidohydrolase-like isoform X2 [Pongo abelii]|uniref:protein N-terminal asparagine amidohydrolase-like isoform X2 n=1 Tax=Pongo abelii TaxID=9601 RepID=UPI0030062014
MRLLAEGRRVRLQQLAGDLVRAHPPLEERARLLRGQCVQQVGPQGFLYVQQTELVVASPKDGSISILGSDDATTCHIVVLRHTGNGATCLTRCDRTDTKAEVPLIMNSIKSFSDHAQCGRLEVHLVGGFSDDRQLSQKLTHQLLSEFDRQEDDIHLVTLRVTELNDREENENHFPIIYGIAVNIKTAEIYRASFQDRGPEEQLRAAQTLAGGPMVGDTQECHRSEDRQEHHQLTRIADPMLAEMGKNLKEAMKMLEDSQRRTEEENGKELISGDIPGPLQGRW